MRMWTRLFRKPAAFFLVSATLKGRQYNHHKPLIYITHPYAIAMCNSNIIMMHPKSIHFEERESVGFRAWFRRWCTVRLLGIFWISNWLFGWLFGWFREYDGICKSSFRRCPLEASRALAWSLVPTSIALGLFQYELQPHQLIWMMLIEIFTYWIKIR